MNKLFFGLAALLAAATVTPAEAAVNVVATTQDIAAITQDIGGSNVVVSYISRGDLDPHFVDAKPSFMVKLASADLLISVGMELEIGWLPSLITGSRNPKIASGPGNLEASTGINKIEVPTGTIDRSRGDLHPAGNPHYWLDPENGRGMARVIEARLAQIDATHAADYQKNLATFEAHLTQKEGEWATKLAPLKGAAIVGYHSTFDYFIARYGMNLVGFVEPKPGIPPTPQHTMELASQAKAANAKFVFVEPYHSSADAAPIATASGAKVVTLPTSVGAEAGVVTYFDLFDHIVHTLTGA